MRPRFPFALLVMLALALATAAVGCPCVRGAINANESVRWWLFANFGASKICPELLKRGVPLKFAALGNNSIGRFFPQRCDVTVHDPERSIIMNVGGTGYATLPVTRRVGFLASVSVEFRPDFRMESDAMYVWGRFNRLIAPPSLQIIGVENPIANLATRTPLGDVATVLGQGIVASEIARGFTVVRLDDGDDFTLGILTPPERPPRTLAASRGRMLLTTDMTELSPGSRDYIGPLAVDGNGQSLYVRLQVTGPPVDYYLVDKPLGDAWLVPYEHAQPLGPPPGPPLSYATASPGETKRNFPLPPGLYYFVIENRASGLPNPLGIIPFGAGGAAYVSYAAEVGDRP